MLRQVLRPRWLFVAGGLLFFAWCLRIGYLGLAIWRDVKAAETWVEAERDRDPASLIEIVHNLREETGALRLEVWPFTATLGLGHDLPKIGPTLASIGPALDFAADLTLAADECLQTVAPVLNRPPGTPSLPLLLSEAQARETNLQMAVQAARAARLSRMKIPSDAPEFITKRLDQIDPYLPLVEQVTTGMAALPELLGGSQPRTYLILIQNSDELRATGGFISSVGILLLDQGNLTFQIQNSYALDDFPHEAYPPPPEPLHTYMGADLWLFRDANWSPDFPTTARDVAGLYQLGQHQSVAGVLALDQTAFKYILAATGPIPLMDGSGSVSAETLDQFLHDQWQPESGDLDPSVRTYQSGFMSGLGESLMAQILDNPASINLADLFTVLLQILDEKHGLIFVTQPALANLFAAQGWDGALSSGAQDFLYVVDANVGFNKANAALQRSIDYQVDLTDLTHPNAILTVSYQLTGQAGVPCDQIDENYGQQGYETLAQGCYWNYLRLYAPQGSTLISGESHPTPGEWLWNGRTTLGLVETGMGEAGTAVFDQFLVVPSGGRLSARVSYQLPARVVHFDPLAATYCAIFEKQPGTEADPLQVTLKLPEGALVQNTEPVLTRQAGNTLTYNLQLRMDQYLCVTFGR